LEQFFAVGCSKTTKKMQHNFIIRRAEAEDAPALTRLSFRSKQSNGYDDSFMAACIDELTVSPEQIRENEFWLAEDDKAVIGCACLIINQMELTGIVVALFIDPDRQKTGLGRLLWNRLVTSAKMHRLEKLSLDTDPFAVGFYRAMGLKIVGQSPSGSITGRMLPRMEIIL